MHLIDRNVFKLQGEMYEKDNSIIANKQMFAVGSSIQLRQYRNDKM